ncbi:MAG: type II toxin-antitoxin system death-on-curing family toxin [Candidatus Daviesbacteria bacterium]|nr:MAG: type II toxin-antitoxin system death-on-curing family toxin [Candidatus Daviesbacteria bacterium]
MRWLEPQDFEFLCFDLARELMTFQEPIPNYSTRDNGLLESSLGAPKQTFGGKFLYPTLEKQAAILFYSLIKNHPFKNGNKRIAVMALLAFLSLNGKWINIDPLALYTLAFAVSESDPKDKNKILKIIEKRVMENLVNFPTK